MTIPYSDIQQDTIPRKHLNNQDTIGLKRDTGVVVLHPSNDSLKHRAGIYRHIVVDNSDTTSVCPRNSIADITFFDFNNFIRRLGFGNYRKFPYVLVDKGKEIRSEQKTLLIRNLKSGTGLPSQPLHTDWMLVIILIAVFLFTLVKQSSRSLSESFSRYFLFRGVNEWGSRELGGLFHWQSTVLNLVSFLILGIFGYSAASYFGIIPDGMKGILIWVIVIGIISAAITLRHAVCWITGAVSGQEAIFREYLIGIYQSYRFGALFLFVIIILTSYTKIFPAGDLIITGIIIAGLMYLIRVIRLMVIFLNRNISIFYLILYLCALEILPVLIIAKYFTGLV